MDNDIIKQYLYDINESIISIEDYIGSKKDFNDYKNNKILKRAVEREFEIIGEAMNRIYKRNPNIKISFQKKIISLRNKVIHSYDNVDDIIIWGIILNHLPLLKKEINKLLNH